jgi:hypothetical protein
MRLPDEAPDGPFDLVLLSEVAYYWNARDLAPSGDLLLVHWTKATDYPLSGDAAAHGLIQAVLPFARVLREERTESYRLDLLRRTG